MIRTTRRHLSRLGVVGVGVNLMLYLAYLTMVGVHVEAKVAMSVAYACGVVAGFAINRRWSCGDNGKQGRTMLHYLAVYVAGYLLNLAALVLFVDVMRLAHEAVQAVMVCVVAGFAFLLQKYWVFRLPRQVTEPQG